MSISQTHLVKLLIKHKVVYRIVNSITNKSNPTEQYTYSIQTELFLLEQLLNQRNQ